mgnify:CR=1 FL=1
MTSLKEFSKKLYHFAHLLELIVAVFLAIGAIIGFIDLVKYLIEIFSADIHLSYELFHEFLSHALLIIVAIEFILMLITHSTKTIGELVVFVIARKMLIYGSNMVDMVLGAAAIGIVFATLRYLVPNFKEEEEEY